MTTKGKRRAIPDIHIDDPGMYKILSALKENDEIARGARGAEVDRYVTVYDLIKLGLDANSFKIDGNVAYNFNYFEITGHDDEDAPGIPTGLTITNKVFTNELSWTNPPDDDFHVVEVWTNTSNDRDGAWCVGVVAGNPGETITWAHAGISTTNAYYYWIRAVDYGFNKSGWNPTAQDGGEEVAATPGAVRIAESFYFNRYDMWAGNGAIDNAATVFVLSTEDDPVKMALGPSADNITFAGTQAGFFVDGDGFVRFGNNVYGVSFNPDTGDLDIEAIIHAQGGIFSGDIIVDGNIELTSGYIRAGTATDYVALTASGLIGVSALLGTTFFIPSDGAPPQFSSGIIKETEYQIYDVGVLKISDTEDATPGVGAVGGLLANVNMMSGYDSTGLLFFRTTYNGVDEGDFYAGDYISGNPGMFYDHSAGTMNYRGVFQIASGSLIVNDILISGGGSIRTQEAYPYIEIGPDGIMIMQDDAGGTYGTAQYGTDTYGSGALIWIMNTSLYIPWVEMKEPVNDAGEGVASFRLYNRPDSPDGDGAELGDMCYVDGNLNLCVVAGDPGTYQMVPTTTGNTGGSGSAGAGNQYVELRIDGVTYKLLTDGTV